MYIYIYKYISKARHLFFNQLQRLNKITKSEKV